MLRNSARALRQVWRIVAVFCGLSIAAFASVRMIEQLTPEPLPLLIPKQIKNQGPYSVVDEKSEAQALHQLPVDNPLTAVFVESPCKPSVAKNGRKRRVKENKPPQKETLEKLKAPPESMPFIVPIDLERERSSVALNANGYNAPKHAPSEEEKSSLRSSTSSIPISVGRQKSDINLSQNDPDLHALIAPKLKPRESARAPKSTSVFEEENPQEEEPFIVTPAPQPQPVRPVFPFPRPELPPPPPEKKLPKWHEIKTGNKSYYLTFWLMQLTNPNAPSEEIPFRLALIDTLLCDKYQKHVGASWAEEEDDLAMKYLRRDFVFDYLRAVRWDKTKFEKLFIADIEDLHLIDIDAMDEGLTLPLKLGIMKMEDLDCSSLEAINDLDQTINIETQ